MSDTPPRKKARGHTVIPFPQDNESLLDLRNIFTAKAEKIWVPQGSTKKTKGKGIGQRKAKFKKIRKLCINSQKIIPTNFSKAKHEAEIRILEIFDFLSGVDVPAKMDLLEKFNSKVISGEVRTQADIDEFLSRAQQLADCIKLYLEKNTYCENFMREISYDAFEQGFSEEEQLKFEQKYSDYFSQSAQ